MSRPALYRRYRPQSFEDVLGQEHVSETLQSAIRDERIAHAYLFSGSRGTGKTSTARILAKALNCEKGPTPTPCNACDTCRQITDGSSLDVIEIDAASHGGVDDVRDLRDNALLAPAASRRKVYIVDEAHMVSTQGWNAFLKTVEEPPDHVIFVFATTEPHKVLPTILSRCQRFDFRRVSSTQIADHLAKVCAEEGIDADEGALQLIARHAEGGVRDALSTLDQLASSGTVTSSAAARLLGTSPTELLFAFTDALADGNTAEAVLTIARLIEEGHDLRVFARAMLEHLRALLISRQVPEPGDLIDATDETRARLSAQADRVGGAKLSHWVRLLSDAMADMRQAAPPRLTLELVAVRATMPEVDDTAAGALARIERLERLLEVGATPAPAATEDAPAATPVTKAASKPAPEPAPEPEPAPKAKGKRAKTSAKAMKETPAPEPAPSPAASAGSIDLTKLRSAWPLIQEEVRKESKRVHSYLLDATPVSMDGGELVLEHRFDFHASQLVEPKNAAMIAGAVNTVLGASPRIRSSVRAGSADGDESIDQGIPASSDPADIIKAGFGDDVVEE